MWQTNRQEQPIPEKKLNVTFTIEKNLYEQFKKVAQKDMRKYSNIVEGSIRRYISSRT
jgi:metal-responsive CopG/Arc/MetJ family transcriptional regulator|tara:strand:+ start:482 stop:655 length:174 start_codon:yes stop_codon:yes gene_type:complete